MSNPDFDYRTSADHYREQPDYYRERNKRRRAEVKAAVQRYKEDRPCADCGKQYPFYVMQFDHIDGKVANVAKLSVSTTLPRVMEEIAKCELVCANCHAARTWTRGQHTTVA